MTETWLIYWRHPERLTWDLDEFDTQPEAEAALAEFREKYPYNTYRLAKVERVIEATEKWKAPYTFTTTSNGPVSITVGRGAVGASGTDA